MSTSEMNVMKALQIVWGVVASGILAWGCGNMAQAGEPDNTVAHKVVSFADLNLNSTEGVEVLYRRIRKAAQDVCGTPERYDLSEIKVRPCINAAIARAIAQVDSPRLTSLYQAKSGKGDKKPTVLAQAR